MNSPPASRLRRDRLSLLRKEGVTLTLGLKSGVSAKNKTAVLSTDVAGADKAKKSRLISETAVFRINFFPIAYPAPRALRLEPLFLLHFSIHTQSGMRN
ncbi:MAG: hypothetical protein RBS38_12350, partial [Bacteroidales bacterium]|nr:hypothetical protein [Bacteroidales bacterium]